MYCYVMQPWQTIRSSNTVTTVTQTESCWLDLLPYQDVVAWLEVKEVTTGGGTNVQLAYQTAPAKDDSFFVPIVAAFNVALGVTVKVMLKDPSTNTLARWLRWQLTVTGSPTSTWDATFRIFIAANVPSRGNRPQVAAASAGRSPPLAGDTSAAPSLPLHIDPTGSGGASGIPQPPGFGGSILYTGPQPQPRLLAGPTFQGNLLTANASGGTVLNRGPSPTPVRQPIGSGGGGNNTQWYYHPPRNNG